MEESRPVGTQELEAESSWIQDRYSEKSNANEGNSQYKDQKARMG